MVGMAGRLASPGLSAVEALRRANTPTGCAFTPGASGLRTGNSPTHARPGVDIVVDLPVGFDAGGADAWAWQDLCAFDFEVGCPPDPHNTEGQKWGLPPIDPQALVAADFAPFIAMVRAGLRHAAALRMDHVMQLWRLFWVPQEGAAAGAYLTYPVDALLAVLRLEACRAGAWVVGEDMGTVADGVRETMASIGMLGYRTSMRSDPADNPEGTMAAAQTHDQATIVGLVTGSDVADMVADRQGSRPAARRRGPPRVARGGGPARGCPEHAGDLRCRRSARRTARSRPSPSRIVLLTLDDAAAVAERPNMPGTIDQWPNWRIALPAPVEDLLRSPLASSLAAVMGDRHRPLGFALVRRSAWGRSLTSRRVAPSPPRSSRTSCPPQDHRGSRRRQTHPDA